MDDQKPVSTSTPEPDSSASPRPTGGQFMDIQTKPFNSGGGSAPILSESPDTEEAPLNTNDDTNSMATEIPDEEASQPTPEPIEETDVALSDETSTPPEVTPEPSPDTPTEASSPTNIEVTSTTDTEPSQPSTVVAADTPNSPSNDHNSLAIPPRTPKKSGIPMLVIVIAIVIALGLAGLVVFMFMKTKKDTVGTNKTANSTSTQTAVKPLASPADVDTTNTAIQNSLNKVNDSTDFSATDLSDKSLGL